MMKPVIQVLIRFYRAAISPLMAPRCRYVPTCSCYAHEAIGRYGVLKGGILAFLRICRCHPLSRRPMHDPVPERLNWPIDLRGRIGYKRGTHKINQ